MKKLDWYILRKFVGTFVFIIALLQSIIIIIDLEEKVDAFVSNHAPLSEIVFGYYVYFIPYMSALIGPFFVLVSVIFFTSQLAGRSEIIAILNSGTSFYRMLWPYFVGAAVFSGFFYVANNYMVPYSNKKRIEFEDKYVSKPPVGIRFNFHRTVAPGVIIYFENYRPSDGTAGRFSIDKFEGGKLVYKLRAEKVMWNKTTHKWHISNYYTRTLHNNGDVITTGASMDSAFTFKPDDFTFGESKKETMTTPQLAQYIDYMRKGGQQDIEFYEVERYRRTSSAFSVFIMTLIGVSLASRKVRGGVGWHFVLGIGLCALYEVIMKFTITFSTNASLPPLLGVWIPNFMYGALAIYLLKRAPK